LDIRKIKDVRVELPVQPQISVLNRAPISVAPISARISAWISVLRISERGFYCGYPWLYGSFDTDIRNFTDIQADISTDSSARDTRPRVAIGILKICSRIFHFSNRSKQLTSERTHFVEDSRCDDSLV